jgi:hypothetical protein
MQRGVDEQNLVAAHAKLPVRERAGTLWRQIKRLSDSVEYNEVVTCPVHFGEVPFHQDIIPYSSCQNVGDSP